MTPNQGFRVAVADRDESLQDAVRSHFTGSEVGWQVDGYAEATSALEGILASPPSLVLMEVSLPGASGFELVQKLKPRLPDLPLIIFTARAEPGTLLKAMMAGASGYLIKPLPPAELVSHVRKALAGGLAIAPSVEPLLLNGLCGLGRSLTALGLSWREQEIMLGICCHKTEKEIANELRLETGTVHAHLMKIFKKLAVHDREAAIRKFLENARVVGGGNQPHQADGTLRALYTTFIPLRALPF